MFLWVWEVGVEVKWFEMFCLCFCFFFLQVLDLYGFVLFRYLTLCSY